MSDTEKPALKSANQNPWYCLATIHGEQGVYKIDKELAEKNRQFWTRWINADLRDHELKSDIKSQFIKRTSDKSLSLPDPTGQADFSHTHFDRAVDFSGFLFRKADFRSSRFSQLVDFRARFEDYARFGSATFVGKTDFSNAYFEGADFESAEFVSMVEFLNTQFAKDIYFNRVKFFQPAYFRRARFIGRVSFEAANFNIAGFEDVKFGERANFRAATLSSASFRSAEFSAAADFSYAKCPGGPEFLNTKFEGNTTFANATFGRVPDFRGAKMHQATEWHGATWPPPPSERASAQSQVYAYERLKQEMEQLKKHEDEQGFFRKELRARRGLARAFSGEWLLNLAYQASSDYGNSFSRPLAWLLVVFAVGVAIFARLPIHCGAPMPFRLAIKLSFANIFVFLPDKREIMTPEVIACLSDTTRLVSAAQSISAVVLLFLLGLAVRNRFRMK